MARKAVIAASRDSQVNGRQKALEVLFRNAVSADGE